MHPLIAATRPSKKTKHSTHSAKRAARVLAIVALTVLAAFAFAPSAHAQTPPDSTATAIPNPVVLNPPPPKTRTLSLSDAQSQILDASFELRLNEQTIKQVQLLESQALSIWIPTVSVAARYTLRDQEISLGFPNPLAPLSPYLDSVYNSDPQLQQFFAANPQVPDARALASAQSTPSVIQFRHNYQLVGTVTQTLFNARAFPLLNLADLSIARAEHAREEIAYQLNAALNQLYFTSIQFQRLISISERNVELARLNLNRARDAADAGVGNRFEVTRAQLNLTKAQRDLTRAHLAYDLSNQALASFLITENNFDTVSPPTLPPPSSCCQNLLDQALSERPDLRGADLTVAFDQERIRESEATFWPVMSAELQGVFQRASAFTGNPFFWTLTVQAQWVIFDGGFRDTETQTREIAAAQSEIRREQLKTKIAADLQQSWLRIQSQQSNVAAAASEASFAAENLSLTKEARDLGAATNLEVELAQEQLYLSELAVTSAEVELQALIYQLYQIAYDPQAINSK